jgi:hypothetical protein
MMTHLEHVCDAEACAGGGVVVRKPVQFGPQLPMLREIQ